MGLIKRIGNYVFKSLQTKIIFIIITFLFIPAFYLLNYSFANAERILVEKISRLMVDSLQQIGNQIENVCMDVIKLSNVLSTDKTIISILPNTNGTSQFGQNSDQKDYYNLSKEEYLRLSGIEMQIDYAKANIFFNYSADVVIIDSDGLIYNSSDSYDDFKLKLEYMKIYKNQEWYRRIISGEQIVIWSAPFKYKVHNIGNDVRFISAARIIKSSYSQKNIGIIMINISEEHFKNILSDQENRIVLLLNENRDIIFESYTAKVLDYNNIFQRIPVKGKGYFFTEINREKFMINYYPLKRFGWNLISVVPYNEVMQEIDTLKGKIFSVNISGFALFLLISVGLILYITNPLKKLIKNIRKFRIGEYSVDLKTEGFPDDVSGIVKSFHYLFKRVEELVQTVIEKKKREHELEYEALRAQITPHFLFNTLNTIKWSAMMSGANNVSRMLSSLGRLLEVSMNKGEDEITFREEFELVESYIFIQNARYNDKFVLKFEVDEGVYNFKILKLLLQPIVENSIIHGFKTIEAEGVICISASIWDEMTVKLEIVDNGEGISNDEMEHILLNDKHYNKMKYSGIGLKNIHERIKLKYGDEYGLEILSQAGRGTTVSLMLPVIH